MAKSLKNIMGAGVAPLMAQMINGTATDSLVATGNNQATALLLPSDVNVFTTVAASTGAILPNNPAPGDEIVVANLGANALSVYPQTGGAIQTGAANAAFSVPAAKSCKFICRVGSLNWIALLSA
jgi:hypothetical protein